MKLEFIVPGTPKAEERHRSTIIGGHIHSYEPVDSKNQKSFIKFIALHEMQRTDFAKTELPIHMEIWAYAPLTKSMSKKLKERALAGKEYPTKKPDVDNIAKLMQDALNDLVYVDDKQIVDLLVYKRYSDEPRTVVKIEEL